MADNNQKNVNSAHVEEGHEAANDSESDIETVIGGNGDSVNIVPNTPSITRGNSTPKFSLCQPFLLCSLFRESPPQPVVNHHQPPPNTDRVLIITTNLCLPLIFNGVPIFLQS